MTNACIIFIFRRSKLFAYLGPGVGSPSLGPGEADEGGGDDAGADGAGCTEAEAGAAVTRPLQEERSG